MMAGFVRKSGKPVMAVYHANRIVTSHWLIYTVLQNVTLLFFNKSLKDKPVLIIFGTRNPETNLTPGSYIFVHRTCKT